MTFLAENLRYLRKSKDLSQQELADALNIKRSRMNSYEQGSAEPKLDLLTQICTYFDTSMERILGVNLAENKNILPKSNLKVLAITVDNEDNENIELVHIKAAAGYASSYGDPEYVRTLPRFRLPFLSRGTFRAFETNGDSMLPIPSGAVVIGEYVEAIKDLKVNETYILITMNNGILFKRVAGVVKDTIVLKSDNPTYSSYSLPLTELQEIWKTKLYMSTHFPEPDNVLNRIEHSLADLKEKMGMVG